MPGGPLLPPSPEAREREQQLDLHKRLSNFQATPQALAT